MQMNEGQSQAWTEIALSSSVTSHLIIVTSADVEADCSDSNPRSATYSPWNLGRVHYVSRVSMPSSEKWA